MNTKLKTTENDCADTDESAEISCYCFILDKPSDASTCKMTARCENASGEVSQLIDFVRKR